MKKILIFEYITGGGLIEKKVDHSLLFEAEIILNSLIETYNYEVNFFCDYRHRFRNKKGAIVVSKNNSEIIYNSKFINKYDFYLPICPETHMIYYTYLKKIIHSVGNINISSAETILATSDKLTFRQICNKKIFITLICWILAKGINFTLKKIGLAVDVLIQELSKIIGQTQKIK